MTSGFQIWKSYLPVQEEVGEDAILLMIFSKIIDILSVYKCKSIFLEGEGLKQN